MSVLNVTEPRTGYPVRYEDWRDYRARLENRPLRERDLRGRVRRCAGCWGFGAWVLAGNGDGAIPARCVGCGRHPLEHRS